METWKTLLLVGVITFLFGLLPFMLISKKGKEHEKEEQDAANETEKNKPGKGKRAA